MNKKLFIILGLTFLLTGGVFWFQQKTDQTNKLSQGIGEDRNYSDWKTYRNEKYKYTVQYPKNWYVDTRYSDDDFRQRGLDAVYNIGGDTYFSNYSHPYDYNVSNPAPEDFRGLKVGVYKVDPTLDYQDFVARLHGVDSRKIAEEYVNISGIESLRSTRITTDHPVGVTFVTTFVKFDDKIFVFEYDDNGKSIAESDRSIFEDIVQSFWLMQD